MTDLEQPAKPPASKPRRRAKAATAPSEPATPPAHPDPLPSLTGGALDAHLKTRTDAEAKKRAGRVTKQAMRKNAPKASLSTPIDGPVAAAAFEKLIGAPQPSTSTGQGIIAPTELKVPGGKVKPDRTNEYGLTEKQELFAREYCLDLNGKHAAIRAGYSRASAHTYAHNLLNESKVWQRIQTLKAEMFKKLDVSHERIVKELTAMAYANIADFMTIDEKGRVNLDIATVMQQAPQLMAGVVGYEVVEMEPVMALDEDGNMAMREVLKHKIKLDKRGAIELLMRHKRMFAPEENLTPEALEALVERMRTDLRLKKASLQAQLMIEKQGGAAGVLADVQDAEFETIEG